MARLGTAVLVVVAAVLAVALVLWMNPREKPLTQTPIGPLCDPYDPTDHDCSRWTATASERQVA